MRKPLFVATSVLIALMGFVVHAAAQTPPRAATDTVRLHVAWKVSSVESRPGEEMGIISSIAEDAAGNVYVADLSAAVVRVYGANSQSFPTIGRKGAGPGEFTAPAGLGIGPDGMLYVRDQSRYTRFRMNVTTKRLTTYDGNIQRSAMNDWTSKVPVRFGRANTLYEPNFSMFTRPPKFSGRYYRYSARGELQDSVMVPLFPNSPAPVAVLRTSASGGRMIYGLNHVPFAALPVWDLTSAGTLISGTGDRYVLTECDASGTVLHSYNRNVTVDRIPARERADSVAALRRRIDSLPVPIGRVEGVPSTVARLELPQAFPFYSAVYSAVDGKVWVRRWTSGNTARTIFDVFAREGPFIATVTLPAVISSDVHPVLTLDRVVAVVVDAETGENMVYSFAAGARP